MTDLTVSYNAALDFLNGEGGETPLASAAIEAPPLDEGEQRGSGLCEGRERPRYRITFKCCRSSSTECNGGRRVQDALSPDDSDARYLYLEVIERFLGGAAWVGPGKTTTFGKKNNYRVRLDMIVSRDLLERRLRRADGAMDLRARFQWDDAENSSVFSLDEAHSKIHSDFGHST